MLYLAVSSYWLVNARVVIMEENSALERTRLGCKVESMSTAVLALSPHHLHHIFKY